VSLHDTDALVIETAGAAESLPDPVALAGRTHRLSNTGAAPAVWSAPGAAPFTDALGQNVSSLTVPAGSAVQLQSDGVRWVVKGDAAASGRRVFAGSGVSDGSGNVTFNFTPPFAAVPVVTNAVQSGSSDLTECRISALSAASVTFNVRRSPGVVVVGISVLQVPQPAPGVTVHCVATSAGQA
jgi:hypothetical protein